MWRGPRHLFSVQSAICITAAPSPPRYHPLVPPVRALSFDFYMTLARHRDRGRGPALMEYFAATGLESDPWEHQVLYDVFVDHHLEYDPAAADDQRRRYHLVLARRVFDRLHVKGGRAEDHAENLWSILGPSCFELFPEVPAVLERLKRAGYPMAVVSNWQHGLANFMVELGIRGYFEHVLCSEEVGSNKPDAGIFLEACRRLGTPPGNVLHVGDTWVDDWEGGRAAGLQVVLIAREPNGEPVDAPTIASLAELPVLLGLE